MGTWASSSDLETFLGTDNLEGMSDDSADPSTVTAAPITQAIAWAEAEVKEKIRVRYPDAVDAGTASVSITRIVVDLALGRLAMRRPGPGAFFSTVATDAASKLDDIRRGYRDVPEWEVLASTTDSITTGKIEPQADGDLFDCAIDIYRVPNEHSTDER